MAARINRSSETTIKKQIKGQKTINEEDEQQFLKEMSDVLSKGLAPDRIRGVFPALLSHCIHEWGGIQKLSRKTGFGRESLYKALREDAEPRFSTISRILGAMGARLSVVPFTEAERKSFNKTLKKVNKDSLVPEI